MRASYLLHSLPNLHKSKDECFDLGQKKGFFKDKAWKILSG